MVSRAGFSLVEAEIALVLFAAGLLAIAGHAGRAAAVLREAEARQGSTMAAVSVADSLMQMEHPQDGATVRSRYAVSWTTTATSGVTHVHLIVKYSDGSTIRLDSLHAVAATWPRKLSRVP